MNKITYSSNKKRSFSTSFVKRNWKKKLKNTFLAINLPMSKRVNERANERTHEQANVWASDIAYERARSERVYDRARNHASEQFGRDCRERTECRLLGTCNKSSNDSDILWNRSCSASTRSRSGRTLRDNAHTRQSAFVGNPCARTSPNDAALQAPVVLNSLLVVTLLLLLLLLDLDCSHHDAQLRQKT